MPAPEVTAADPTCLFCRIVAGEVPARFVHRNQTLIAFHDVNPQAPVHILVVPVRHIASAADLTQADGSLLGQLFDTAAQLGRDLGVAETGYRMVINTRDHGGQTVHHLHVHLLGGRRMGWPPG